jgi:glycosyltransferase involved in cell wall biosynthesis
MNQVRLPTISIIMPSFNQGRFLREAIESVLSQHYPLAELLLLDGGSTDGSTEIVREYAARIAFARSGPDDGQTAALIEGISRSTGDLVGWLNSDDILFPGALWSIATAYSKAPDAALIGGNYLLIDADGRVLRCKRHPRHASWWARAGLLTVNQPGSFFSREAYIKLGGLRRDLDYVMDTEFYIRLLNSPAARFLYLNEWLAGFRLHGANKTYERHSRDTEHIRALSQYPVGRRRILSRAGWAWVYRMHQIINGNYPRMALETWLARGQDWHAWARDRVTPTELGSRYVGPKESRSGHGN